MISFKNSFTLIASAFVAVSCSPMPPEAGLVVQEAPDTQKIIEQQKADQAAAARAKARQAAAAKKAAAKKSALAKKAEERKKQIASKKTVFEDPGRPPEPPKPVKPKYPTAKSIPGKPGFVFNPYTYEPVDVRGIPGQSLVFDPNDPDKSAHKFRVP